MPGHKIWQGPPIEAWLPWRPAEVASVLSKLSIPWCVVGGWAIDLWLGEQSRPHADLEIAICRSDFSVIHDYLNQYELYVINDGEATALRIGEIPPVVAHQNWVLDQAANAWRLDIMLEPGDADTWVFRRKNHITFPRSQIVSRNNGIPYLNPEGVLLYKAKAHRDKDEADFSSCLPKLDTGARTWLAMALQNAHPGHHWIAQLC